MTLPDDGDPQKPDVPRRSWREREKASRSRGAFLDPALQPAGGAEVYGTVYEPDVVLVSPVPGRAAPRAAMPDLADIAARLGWVVTPEPLEDAAPDGEDSRPRGVAASEAVAMPARIDGVAETVRARISVSPDADPTLPMQRPDAWTLVREARRESVAGVSLNHVLTVDSLGANPFKGNPFKGNPFKGNPFKGNPFKGNAGDGLEGYAYPGFGGRQPIYYVGPELPTAKLEKDDRPIVAVLDTGCGTHPWLTADDLVDPVSEWGGAIGVIDPHSDPESDPSLGDPLDGVIDDAAGHGTFIAGLVRQTAPEARILPVRVADGNGVILENDLLGALGRIVALLEKGARIDVLNLSFSFYHESPNRIAIESELYSLLLRARRRGCVVVCSAGNDATDRPSSPAALYAWPDSDFEITKDEEAGAAPQVAVGALNPSGRSIALFSNIGPWVTTYARGVSLLSSVPTTFEGGVQADLRRDEYGRRRETLDIDDFSSGYAVWSGTSFAAPIVAGRIAAVIAESRKTSAGLRQEPDAVLARLHGAVRGIVDELALEDRSTET